MGAPILASVGIIASFACATIPAWLIVCILSGLI
jgi:hypothetical protein